MKGARDRRRGSLVAIDGEMLMAKCIRWYAEKEKLRFDEFAFEDVASSLGFIPKTLENNLNGNKINEFKLYEILGKIEVYPHEISAICLEPIPMKTPKKVETPEQFQQMEFTFEEKSYGEWEKEVLQYLKNISDALDEGFILR